MTRNETFLKKCVCIFSRISESIAVMKVDKGSVVGDYIITPRRTLADPHQQH